jgi:DNA-binding NarL/FixJ family response regulator
MSAIRVLIVDDHPMIRHGLQSLLSAYPDIQVVGDAESGSTALQAAEKFSPEIILLDIKMPGLDGVELIKKLSQNVPESKIIMLTAFDNDEYLLGAFTDGAYAYLLKNSPSETIVETIRLVYQGKRLLSPSQVDPVLRQFQVLGNTHDHSKVSLSEKEIQLIRLIASGATGEKIDNEMHWSKRTTQRKVDGIIAKLGARNRAQAVAEAIKRDLI